MKALTPHQKLGLGVFIILGAATLLFGALRIRNQITLPFDRSGFPEFKTSEQRDAEQVAKLKSSDTDTDGLTDYDELYVYHTSPFLPDTDSDGDADGAEVKAATDPNCPKGQQCRAARSAGDSAGAPIGNSEDVVAAQASGSQFVSDKGTLAALSTMLNAQGGAAVGAGGEATASSQNDQLAAAIEATFGDVSGLTSDQLAAKVQATAGAQLRSFLVAIGIPEADVRKADDTTLRQLVTEAFRESVAAQAQASATAQ